MAAIRYHVSWPSGSDPYYLANPSEVNTRVSFYSVSGVPAGKYDGWDGGSYQFWLQNVQSRLQVQSHLLITIGGTYSAPSGTVTASVTADSQWTTPSGGAKIYFIIAEDNLSYAGKTWRNVFRDGLPNTSGQDFTINPGQTKHITQSFTLGGSWNPGNCYVVVFVQQNPPWRNIYASNKHAVTTLVPTSVEPQTIGTIKSFYH